MPFWSGFNSSLLELPSATYTAKSYPPIIDAKPSDMATIYTCMKRNKAMSQELGQKWSVQTMDQQLFAVAMQVKWTNQEEFEDHYIRLGSFHTLCTYIASLGKLWGSAGLRDLLADSGVYAPGIVDLMLQGKEFNRAFPAFTKAYEALKQTYLESFWSWIHSEDVTTKISTTVWDQLSETLHAFTTKDIHPATAERELENELEENVLPLLERFCGDPRSHLHSKCGKCFCRQWKFFYRVPEQIELETGTYMCRHSVP